MSLAKLTRITKGHDTRKLRLGKLVAEKGVSTAGDPDCLRVFLFLVKAVARAGYPSPTN
jgi:hypothetical protein